MVHLPLPLMSLLLALTSWTFSSIKVSGVNADDNGWAGEEHVRDFFGAGGTTTTSTHTNNWAVLVCASRYWFNYRHMANALGMYRTVKRLGIPDSQIILMLADDVSCNARNRFPGAVYGSDSRSLDLYGDNIEVDYRGYEVTVENFIRVLTGRVDPSLPRSKRLLTDDKSNIFVYMTGHGGNEFLKFQDNEEISAFDVADAFEQMWQKKRYNEILFMIDTCQANTMYSKFYSPNILATGSSEIAENSYSHQTDFDIGVAVIDSFTYHVLHYMEGVNKTSDVSMKDLFDTYSFETIHSHAGVRSDLFKRSLADTRITDFFGAVAEVEVVNIEADVGVDVGINFSIADNEKEVSDIKKDEIVNSAKSLSNDIDAGNASYWELESVTESESDLKRWRELRMWIAFGILGGLVGLVTVRSRSVRRVGSTTTK